MSVITEADRKIQEAKNHLANAYSALLVVLDESTHGHHDLRTDFIDDVNEMAGDILKMKRKL